MAKLIALAALCRAAANPTGSEGLRGSRLPTTRDAPGRCVGCGRLQTFEESDPEAPQCSQKCPDQERFQWIKDLINQGCNQVWQLEAKTYYVDRQYLLPCGVSIRGAGSGPGGTVIKAVRCETDISDLHGIGNEGVKYRIGFVLNHNTSISNLRFEGADSTRYAKRIEGGRNWAPEGYTDVAGVDAGLETGGWCRQQGNGFTDLQGGAGFETPGCSNPYACALTPCINGKFTTPACYEWDSLESMAVKNVVLENIVNTNTNVGFFAAPLNEHLGVAFKDDFDLAKHRPAHLRITNFVNEFLWADGLNIHGSYDQVFIDRYHVGEAGDDCIALWSHKDLLGAVTIQNSYAGKCGYMGCYAVYGGSGPLTYINNTCAAGQPPDWAWGSHHCLWLNDQFNGQFSASAPRITGKGWECKSGWTCDGSGRDQLCPVDAGAPWGNCSGTYPYETGLCRAGNS